MTRNVPLLVASVLAALACLHPVLAQAPVEAQTEAFEYFQGFETDADPLQFWTSYDKKYTINFKGPTTEKARSGKQSFKLDITFEETSRFLWHIPIRLHGPEQVLRSDRGRVEDGRGGLCQARERHR